MTTFLSVVLYLCALLLLLLLLTTLHWCTVKVYYNLLNTEFLVCDASNGEDPNGSDQYVEIPAFDLSSLSLRFTWFLWLHYQGGSWTSTWPTT